MNSLKEFINKYNLNIRGYQEQKNIKVLDTDRGKFVIKNKSNYEDGLYEYLINKNFDFILEKEEMDNYEIYPYINQINIPKEEKAIELVYTLSLLHNKTTFYREIVLDNVKKIYEELTEKINYLNYYYHDLQDVIEQKIYMSPAEYLLIRNISLLYSALMFSKQNLDSWYEYKIKQKKERVVLLHNKPCLEHFLVGDSKSLISWNNYKRDIPIYDFLYFYKKDYIDLEMITLFDIYKSRFCYTEDEYLLFITLLSIPEKIVFTRNNYKDCNEVYKIVKYSQKTRDFVLKQNEKYKKENHNEFNE